MIHGFITNEELSIRAPEICNNFYTYSISIIYAKIFTADDVIRYTIAGLMIKHFIVSKRENNLDVVTSHVNYGHYHFWCLPKHNSFLVINFLMQI